jgi:hypothetical protein
MDGGTCTASSCTGTTLAAGTCTATGVHVLKAPQEDTAKQEGERDILNADLQRQHATKVVAA